jgi:hypothetical protein
MLISAYSLFVLFSVLGPLYNKLDKVYMSVGISVLAFLPRLLLLSLRGPEVLVWDYKAMENIANHIVMNGHVPQLLGRLFRLEYLSYPYAFVLWAIVSEVTNLSTELVQLYPVITISFYIILMSIIILLSKEKIFVENRFISVILLVSVAFSVYQFTDIFIYQNYGRLMLLLYFFILIKLVTKETNVNPQLLITLLLIVMSIIFSHSESSIALIVATLGIAISITTTQPLRTLISQLHTHVKLPFTLIIVMMVFFLHHLWGVAVFTQALLNILLNTITGIMSFFTLKATYVGLSKFTPWDYTAIEIYSYLVAWSTIAILTAYSLINLVFIIVRERRVPLSFGILATSALAFAVLILFSPYKVDIALKFTTILFYALAMSFVEIGYIHGFTKRNQGFLPRSIQTILLLILSLLILWGFTLSSYRSYLSEFHNIANVYAYMLDELHVTDMLNSLSHNNIIIVDSPRLPFSYVRDYIDPRILIPYRVLAADPETVHYNYKLVNGLYMPRFELLLNKVKVLDLNDTTVKGFIISDVRTAVNVSPNLILNINSTIGIAYNR